MATKEKQVFALRVTKEAWKLKDEVYTVAVRKAVDKGEAIPSRAEAYERAFKAYIKS